MKITRCKGEGQGSCTRCTKNGKWNMSWMCFFFEIEGLDGCYCKECVKEIEGEEEYQRAMEQEALELGNPDTGAL